MNPLLRTFLMVAAGAIAFGFFKSGISKILGSPDWLTGGTSTVVAGLLGAWLGLFVASRTGKKPSSPTSSD
jgi:membrane associated rhomboid family serine protease